MAHVPYIEALGMLLFLTSTSRPDIATAVTELARYASNPGKDHWIGLKRIMRYLKGTANFGITYGGGTTDINPDSSYARCPDTRKSRYGGILMINNGPVEWKSKLQSVVALSSIEAEYVGACELTNIISWLSQCLDELRHVRGTTRLKTDNLSSKTFAEDDMVRARSKHVDIKFHYVRDQIKKGLMKLEYCPTGEMIADTLTKPFLPHYSRNSAV